VIAASPTTSGGLRPDTVSPGVVVGDDAVAAVAFGGVEQGVGAVPGVGDAFPGLHGGVAGGEGLPVGHRLGKQGEDRGGVLGGATGKGEGELFPTPPGEDVVAA